MLRTLLGLLLLVAPIVPAARRRTWLAQWRADLWHYSQWLGRDSSTSRIARSCALAARAAGSLAHALVLRTSQWSLHMILHDVRFAIRMLLRRPAFTLVAILVLGVGIGANATIFSWVQSVVLQPVGGVDASPLVALHGKTSSRDDLSFSYLNFTDLRAARPAGIEDVIAFRGLAMNLRGDGEPRRVWGQMVTSNFFDLLRVRPALGRGFIPADTAAMGGEPVAILSHAAWQRLFAGDPGIVGRTITLNARSFTIVGVAPEGFRGTMIGLTMDVFVPITMQKAFMSGDRLLLRGNSFLQVFGRLAPGVSLRQAQGSIDVVAARLAKDHRENESVGIVAQPLWRDGAAGMLLPVMATLMGVVAVVLLIACANLAGLLLARAAGRQREVAIRLAVGASRGRVVRQFLIESCLLAVAGGVAGVAMTTWTTGGLMALMPPTPYPIAFGGGVDLRVIAFATVTTLVTAFAFGLIPALRASSPDVSSSLKEASGTVSGGVRRGRMRGALVVAQVALSLLLLTSAALFLRGLGHARTVDPGFSLRNGAMAAMDLLPNGYDSARGTALHHQLLERVSALPQVTSATMAYSMPLDIGGGSNMSVDIDGYQPPPGEDVDVYYNRVGPKYFETMGIPLVAGRSIGSEDVEGRQLSVVINETMASKYWPGQDPVGKTMRFGSGPATVVGVAKDGKYAKLNEAPRNFMYLPIAQYFRHDAILIVRTEGDPTAVVPALHAEVKKLDANLPLFDVRTINEHMKLSVFLPKLASTLLAMFGGLAVLLAVVGLYSVVAYNVAQRTREIGVRVALGATQAQILRLVLQQGMTLTLIGLGIGAVLSIGAGFGLRSQLMGITPTDPVSFAATTLLLSAVSLLACLVPAQRATRLDPVKALRLE
jgi:macrolide transport system ATP-binding/permease protein